MILKTFSNSLASCLGSLDFQYESSGFIIGLLSVAIGLNCAKHLYVYVWKGNCSNPTRNPKLEQQIICSSIEASQRSKAPLVNDYVSLHYDDGWKKCRVVHISQDTNNNEPIKIRVDLGGGIFDELELDGVDAGVVNNNAKASDELSTTPSSATLQSNLDVNEKRNDLSNTVEKSNDQKAQCYSIQEREKDFKEDSLKESQVVINEIPEHEHHNNENIPQMDVKQSSVLESDRKPSSLDKMCTNLEHRKVERGNFEEALNKVEVEPSATLQPNLDEKNTLSNTDEKSNDQKAQCFSIQEREKGFEGDSLQEPQVVINEIPKHEHHNDENIPQMDVNKQISVLESDRKHSSLDKMGTYLELRKAERGNLEDALNKVEVNRILQNISHHVDKFSIFKGNQNHMEHVNLHSRQTNEKINTNTELVIKNFSQGIQRCENIYKKDLEEKESIDSLWPSICLQSDSTMKSKHVTYQKVHSSAFPKSSHVASLPRPGILRNIPGQISMNPSPVMGKLFDLTNLDGLQGAQLDPMQQKPQEIGKFFPNLLKDNKMGSKHVTFQKVQDYAFPNSSQVASLPTLGKLRENPENQVGLQGARLDTTRDLTVAAFHGNQIPKHCGEKRVLHFEQQKQNQQLQLEQLKHKGLLFTVQEQAQLIDQQMTIQRLQRRLFQMNDLRNTPQQSDSGMGFFYNCPPMVNFKSVSGVSPYSSNMYSGSSIGMKAESMHNLTSTQCLPNYYPMGAFGRSPCSTTMDSSRSIEMKEENICDKNHSSSPPSLFLEALLKKSRDIGNNLKKDLEKNSPSSFASSKGCEVKESENLQVLVDAISDYYYKHYHNYHSCDANAFVVDKRRASFLLEATAGNIDLAVDLYWDDLVSRPLDQTDNPKRQHSSYLKLNRIQDCSEPQEKESHMDRSLRQFPYKKWKKRKYTPSIKHYCSKKRSHMKAFPPQFLFEKCKKQKLKPSSTTHSSKKKRPSRKEDRSGLNLGLMSTEASTSDALVAKQKHPQEVHPKMSVDSENHSSTLGSEKNKVLVIDELTTKAPDNRKKSPEKFAEELEKKNKHIDKKEENYEPTVSKMGLGKEETKDLDSFYDSIFNPNNLHDPFPDINAPLDGERCAFYLEEAASGNICLPQFVQHVSNAGNSNSDSKLTTSKSQILSETKLNPSTIIQMCLPIIDNIINDKFGWVFNVVPNCFNDGKEPSDIKFLKRKLNNGMYEDIETFVSDMTVMFENAISYDGVCDGVLCEMVRTLMDKFNEEIEAMKGKFKGKDIIQKKV